MAKSVRRGAAASRRRPAGSAAGARENPAKRPAPALPAASAGREFQALVEIMARLRGPDGCPWDREQSIESLRGFVLEETYEVLDAIDRRDHAALLGEIGDLIFEGVFLAQIESDEGRFTVSDCLCAITTKLVRRHPHIFHPDGTRVATASQVLEQWEQIKSREQKDAGVRRSLLRGVPRALPSLLRAHEIGCRVAAVGFDWPQTTQVLDKIEEEVSELRRAVRSEGAGRAEEEMGDLLFSIANLARKLGIEPESALRKANEKFSGRFEAVEHAFESRGQSVHDATLEAMEAEWQRVKVQEAAALGVPESPGVAVPSRRPAPRAKDTKIAGGAPKARRSSRR
jgi:MazG family protein